MRSQVCTFWSTVAWIPGCAAHRYCMLSGGQSMEWCFVSQKSRYFRSFNYASSFPTKMSVIVFISERTSKQHSVISC